VNYEHAKAYKFGKPGCDCHECFWAWLNFWRQLTYDGKGTWMGLDDAMESFRLPDDP